MSKRAQENQSCLYELGGCESLGSSLQVQPCSDEAQELSKCSVQWYRIPTEGSRREIISGIHSIISWVCDGLTKLNLTTSKLCSFCGNIIFSRLVLSFFGVKCSNIKLYNHLLFKTTSSYMCKYTTPTHVWCMWIKKFVYKIWAIRWRAWL